MADEKLFVFDGQYKKSSEIPTIKVNDALRKLAEEVGMSEVVEGKTEIPRQQMWDMFIQQELNGLPKPKEGEPLIYVATGGGYGANEMLLAAEQESGRLPANLVAIEGHKFRNHPVFAEEYARVREQIREQTPEEVLKANPNHVEQILSSFYSDEVNTQITKEAVKAAFGQHSVAHKSSSIYDDTGERAELAQQKHMTTVLIAGNRSRETMSNGQEKVAEYLVKRSYHEFTQRLTGEKPYPPDEEKMQDGKKMQELFDQIRLYDTTGETPILIAEKTGPGRELEIKNPMLYAQFVANLSMSQQELSPSEEANITAKEAAAIDEKEKAKRQQQQGAPEQGKDMSEILPPMPMGAPMPKSSGVTPPGP